MTEVAPEQRETVRMLADPATHGGAPVERVDTHISHVFLAGDRALKLRRSMRANFLDFSTPARREAACRREMEINAAAGALYRRVIPVKEGPGGPALGGEGPAIDWVTEMARFDRETEFDRLAERSALTIPLVEGLADVAAETHRAAPQARGPGAAEGARARIAQIAGAILAADGARADAVARWRAAAEAAAADHAARIEARGRRGCVRRCHGDLHLGNVCLFEGRPTLFDAIEFDEAIATIDVSYDLAFALMDLMERGLDALAAACLSRWLSASRDHSGLALLPLHVSMRAAVRAIAAAGAPDAAPSAEHRLAFATEALAPPPPPVLLAVGGPSASGKSALSRALAPRLGARPGAVQLRSDVARKRLFGVAPEYHLPASAYAPETDAQVYARLRAEARRTVRAGFAALFDAAFLDRSEQAAAAALARALGVPFLGLWLDAPLETLAARAAARRGDASDADEAVIRRQLDRRPEAPGWRHVDASGTPEATLGGALDALDAAGLAHRS